MTLKQPNPEHEYIRAVEDPIDPYDPEAMRVNVLADIGVEKTLTTVPVRKPKRNEFFRVHPEYVTDALVLERDDGMNHETYLVVPEIRDLVADELRPVRLFVVINKYGTVSIWPAKLPREDHDGARRWAKTALLAAEEAKTLWVKMFGNRDLGGYEISRAKGDLGKPQWPDKTFRDLIEIAFREHLIDRADHPVIRELAGEL